MRPDVDEQRVTRGRRVLSSSAPCSPPPSLPRHATRAPSRRWQTSRLLSSTTIFPARRPRFDRGAARRSSMTAYGLVLVRLVSPFAGTVLLTSTPARRSSLATLPCRTYVSCHPLPAHARRTTPAATRTSCNAGVTVLLAIRPVEGGKLKYR